MSEKNQTKLPAVGTQSRRILDFMLQGNCVSSAIGINITVFNPIIMRVPNRIGELRHKYGYKIYQREKRSKINRRVKWQEYSLEPLVPESGQKN